MIKADHISQNIPPFVARKRSRDAGSRAESPLELLYRHEFGKAQSTKGKRVRQTGDERRPIEAERKNTAPVGLSRETAKSVPTAKISIAEYRRRKTSRLPVSITSIGKKTGTGKPTETDSRAVSPVLSLHGEEEINDAWFAQVAHDISQPNQNTDEFADPSDSESELLLEEPKDGRLSLLDAEQTAKPDPTGPEVDSDQIDTTSEAEQLPVDVLISSGSIPDIEITVEYLPPPVDCRGRSITPADVLLCTSFAASEENQRRTKTESRKAHKKRRRARRRQQISRYAAASMRKQAKAALKSSHHPSDK